MIKMFLALGSGAATMGHGPIAIIISLAIITIVNEVVTYMACRQIR
jgi:Flp pilus assembly pilin Flp